MAIRIHEPDEWGNNPFIYDPARQELHVANNGGDHNELWDPYNPDAFTSGWRGRYFEHMGGPNERRAIDWYEPFPPKEVGQAVHDAMGVPEEYYNPEEDDAAMRWRFHSSMQLVPLPDIRRSPMVEDPDNHGRSKPFIYHPQEGKVFLGPVGSTHGSIIHSPEFPPGLLHKMFVGRVYPQRGKQVAEFFDEPPSVPEAEEVGKTLGVDRVIGGEFHHGQNPTIEKFVTPLWSFQSKTASSRSLYHGTLLDNLPSIMRNGLTPEVGDFVSDSYGLDPEGNMKQGEDTYTSDQLGVQPAVFMADKKRLQRAYNAISHNVGQKLNKPMFKVTPDDIRNHGLLVKQKGQMGAQDPPATYVWDEEHEEPFEEGPNAHQPFSQAGEGPYQAEPGDYYHQTPVTDLEYIHGPAMMRVFERHGVGPYVDPATWQIQSNTTRTWHYNKWTGERCNCPWNDEHIRMRKLGGPNMNKVLKAPDKKLNTPEGREFKALLQDKLGETYDSLAPYFAHRYKRGDIRLHYPTSGPDAVQMQFWQGRRPLEEERRIWHEKEAEQNAGANPVPDTGDPALNQMVNELAARPNPLQFIPPDGIRSGPGNEPTRAVYTPEKLEQLEDQHFNPLQLHNIDNWHKWYEARQHPLRKGVNVLDGDWTPSVMDARAREHRSEVEREERVAEHSRSGYLVHEFPPHPGGPTGQIDWDDVKENESEYANNAAKVRKLQELERIVPNAEGHAELRSLLGMYPKILKPRKPGWHIKGLSSGEDLHSEGMMMGHCIGSDDKYTSCLENEQIEPFSLRDPKGQPHVTWHYNSDGSLAEIFGPNDDPVKPEYQDMLDEWGENVGRPVRSEDAVGHQEEDYNREMPGFTFPSADTMDEYTTYHDPDHYYDYAGEYDDEGRTVGENTELDWENPNWDKVAEDYLEQYPRVYHAPEGTPPEEAEAKQKSERARHEAKFQQFHNALRGHSQERDMQEALQDHLKYEYGDLEEPEEPDSNHVENLDRWNSMFPNHYVSEPDEWEQWHTKNEAEEPMQWSYYHNRQGPTGMTPPEPGWTINPAEPQEEQNFENGELQAVRTRRNQWPQQGQQQMFSGWTIKADKFNDFLMNPKSRPDLQTEEAQRFLAQLKPLVNEKTDPLMPWLVREWKKGRLHHNATDPGSLTWTLPENPNHHMGINTRNPNLPSPILNHWGDFLKSNHPLRKELGDIMQHPIHEFNDKITAWNQAMQAEMDREKEEEAAKGGTVVHKWPDNWTVRRLHTPQELEAEGDAMGHCVGSYSQPVDEGHTMIYSLRDPQGFPHVTTEVCPNIWENDKGDQVTSNKIIHDGSDKELGWEPIPHKGEVEQIQGRANKDPKPEYKQRMREWFETIPEDQRPEMMDVGLADYLNDPRDIEEAHYSQGEKNEYGLREPPADVDWLNMVDRMVDENERYPELSTNYADEVYKLAKARQQIPEMGHVFTQYRKAVENNLERLIDQNHDYLFDQIGPHPEMIEEPHEAEQWEYEKPYHEMTPEEQGTAEEEYYRREEEASHGLSQSHPGMKSVKDMEAKLNQHFNPITGEYQNEPYEEPVPVGQTMTPAGFR